MKRKKLGLRIETIRKLSPEALVTVAGGSYVYNTINCITRAQPGPVPSSANTVTVVSIYCFTH